MLTRRQFLRDAGATALGASLVSKLQAASLPEAPLQTVAATQPPLVPPNGGRTTRS
jgi:manganese oxidase